MTFADRNRRAGHDAGAAAVDGAEHRLRPILMTSLAMVAGMLPMALALGSGSEQTAPLARAVIGGLVASTLSTLLLLPALYAIMQTGAGVASVSLDPEDPASASFSPMPASDGMR